jgi:hypothetical protein
MKTSLFKRNMKRSVVALYALVLTATVCLPVLSQDATNPAAGQQSTKKPLSQGEVFNLLAGQVPSQRVAMLVQERGIDFEPTENLLKEVRLAGGEDELISALKAAKVAKPGQTTARQYYSELIEHASSFEDFLKLALPGTFNLRSPLVCFPNDPMSLPANRRSDTDFFIISPSTPDYLRDEVGAKGSELEFQSDLAMLEALLQESKTLSDPALLAKLSKGFLAIRYFDRGIGDGSMVLPLYSGFDFRSGLGDDAVGTVAKWAKEDNQLAILKMISLPVPASDCPDSPDGTEPSEVYAKLLHDHLNCIAKTYHPSMGHLSAGCALAIGPFSLFSPLEKP